MSQITKHCSVCASEFVVPHWRARAKFCSPECYGKSRIKPANAKCCVCGVEFKMKASAQSAKVLGVTCSLECSAKLKSRKYSGKDNPNFKGKNTDSDGYRIYVPNSHKGMPLDERIREDKLHRAIACQVIGVIKVPEGLHVHHRDCDVLNNVPENLSVLTASDHKWLHKQYGNATLWAMCSGKLKSVDMAAWSDDPERALFLLALCVTSQRPEQIGVVKGGELLENPEAGNQQPSLEGNF